MKAIKSNWLFTDSRWFTTISFLVLLLVLSGCEKTEETPDIPNAIQQKIQNQQNNCLERVEKYSFEGEDAYLFVTNCPDSYINLYNTSGKLICSPSGGMTGEGDAACPNFYTDAKFIKTIWTKE